MTSLELRLRDFMLSHGVSNQQAEAAAAECAQRITKRVELGVIVGAGIGLATRNPAALVMAAATGTGLGVFSALGSPSCQEVRDAAMRLANGF